MGHIYRKGLGRTMKHKGLVHTIQSNGYAVTCGKTSALILGDMCNMLVVSMVSACSTCLCSAESVHGACDVLQCLWCISALFAC